MAEDIWGDATERVLKRQGLGNILDDQDPVLARRASRLGIDLGLPAPAVSADLEGFEKEQQHQTAKSLFDYAPGLAAFAADPAFAAKAKDDLPSLAEISKALGTAEHPDPLGQNYMRRLRGGTALSSLGMEPGESYEDYLTRRRRRPEQFKHLSIDTRSVGVFEGLTETVERSASEFGLGAELFLADMVGLGDQYRSTDYYARNLKVMKERQELSEAPAEQASTYLGQQAYRAGQSLTLLGSAILTGRPITAFGLGTGGEAYQRFRERGAEPNEALAGAVATGGAEAAFEALPVNYLLGNFGKQATKRFIGGLLLREVPTELATTATQNFVDAVVTGGAGIDEYLNNLPKDLMDTAVSTAMMTGALGGINYTTRRLRPQVEEQEDIGIALASAQYLDGIMANAEASKLRAEDPAGFREFVDRHAENTPVRNIFVPAEAVATYMQSEGYDGSLDRFSEQIAEAQATQGDVVIPVADAATYLAGTPAWQALREDTRITPGGFSQREAQEKSQELFQSLEAEGKAMAEQAEAAGVDKAAIAETKDQIKNAIIATGRVSSTNAEAVAEIAAHRYALRGSQRGQTPMQAWEEAKVSFLGVEATGRQRGRQLAQQEALVNIGLAIPEGGMLTVEEALAELGKIGVSVVAQDVRQSATEPTLIAKLSRPLSATEGRKLSKALRQEAIAQRVGEEGALYGPAAKKWGPFNPEFFLDLPDEVQAGVPRQDVLPEAGWTPERLSGLIDRYGREDGSASAIAVMMTPDEYLGALASAEGRKLIEERVEQLPEYGEIDIERLRASGPPVMVIKKGGEPSAWQIANDAAPRDMVVGHDGRHRAMMLKKAGVGRFPVVIELLDNKGNTLFTKEPMAIRDAIPNRSRASQVETGDTPVNAEGVPLSWKFHDQLKELSGNGRVLFQSQEDVFYSALERAIRDSKQAKATGQQWLATLRKTPGVKQEELEWTGLVELLESTEGPVTRDQLVELLENGGIQLDEVMLNAEQHAHGRTPTEIMEAGEAADWDEANRLADAELERMAQFQSWSSDPSNPTYRELLITLPVGLRGNPKRAPSTHWDVEAVVAHTRFMDKTDAEGKRVLFVEEIQSDWHQKGRDQGYEAPIDPVKVIEAKRAVEEADDALKAVLAEIAEAGGETFSAVVAEKPAIRGSTEPRLSGADAVAQRVLTGDLQEAHAIQGIIGAERFLDLRAAYNEARQNYHLRGRELEIAEGSIQQGIPNAPFKTSWPALVMKRLIRYAAENGYDRVAWTTGEEQAERYNLSQATGPITISLGVSGYVVKTHHKLAEEHIRQQSGSTYATGGGVNLTEEQVLEVFGRDLGRRMLDALPEGTSYAVIEGDDLRIGGEGMKAFYDRNLVNITNDIIKKYGAKVGPVGIPTISDSAIAAQRETARRLRDMGEAERAVEAEATADRLKHGTPHPGFDVTDKMREAVLQGQPLFQQERGSINLMNNGEKIIRLFANADASTLIHELSHAWLEELRVDALDPNSPQQVKDDWETTKVWFRGQGHEVADAGPIQTAAHELWARGGERFVMEGKAPTSALNRVFNLFRAWMTRIYQVVENLNSPITPEIREVFGRLLATQDEIEAQARIQNAAPLFKSAEDAGMSEAEFADYTARVGEARDEAYNALLFKTMEAIRRRRLAEQRDQRANVRSEVGATIGRQPQFVALHLLRTGRWLGDPDRPVENVKLNTGWLIDNFGEDILDKLPRGLPITRGDGQEGDVIAEMVGMASGSELVHALVGMRAASDQLRAGGEKRSLRNKMIDDEVDRVMAERHGDVLSDGSIEEEAIAALNTAAQGEIISAEIRQLTKRTSIPGRVTPYQHVREWAKRKIAAGKVVDVASRSAMQRYTRAAAKASRAAEEAILAGNIDETYKQKQAQLINHALLAESKAAADRIDTIVARMKRLSKRAAMQSVDRDYMDKVHMLLENYDFRPRSQRSIDEQEGFEAWMLDQRAKGYEVHIPPRLENNGTPYSRVSVEELEAFNDLIESLLHLGKTKQKLKTAQGERDFAEWRDEALAHMQQLPNRKLPEKPINEERRTGAAFAAELLKVETLAEELDGGQTGPMTDLLVHGATEAENKRVSLRERVMKPLTQLYLSMGRKQWKRMQDRVTIPELTWNTLNEGDPRIGQPVTMTRMELLTVALNMGNLSNLEKMARGERWPVGALKQVVDRELTKEDWDFVQSLWTQVEKLWPDIVAVEREMSGVVPEKVVNSPIDTRFGTYEGGYWPVVYDAGRWQRAEDLEGEKVDDMFGLKSGVATQKGHTIERTAAFGPISYNLENILFNHVEQVVTRIAYAPFARQVLKAVRDKAIRGMIDTKLGPEYRKIIEPWLQRQINEGASMSQGARWWSGILRQARINLTIAAMGLRISTGVAQTLGLTASAQRIGARWVGTGFKTLALNPRRATQFVWDRSSEMLHRTENFSREMNELSNRMRQKHRWWTEAQHWAMWHIGMIDRYAVSLPTWLGAHAKGINQGMTDEEASRFADKSVRMSQGSGREKDLAWVQSMANGEAFRFFTMFYTPFNVLFNAQWQGVRGLRRGDVRPAIAVTFWWMMASMLGDAMLSGDWPEDEDEDGAKDWGAWAARNIFFGMFAGVPLARDLATGTERTMIGEYTDPGSTPVTRVYDAVDRSWQIGDTYAEEGELPEKPVKTFGNLAAVFTGLPLGQPAVTGQFLWDYSQGEANPQGITDWYFGISKGKVPSEEQE
jgi:hypothetical protein